MQSENIQTVSSTSKSSLAILSRKRKLKKSEDYKLNSGGLIVSWTFNEEIDANLIINNVFIDIPRDKKEIFITSNIRNKFRDIFNSSEQDENTDDYINLEREFFIKQLLAFEAFGFLGDSVFFNTIYTPGLDIKFSFDGKEKSEVEVSEQYYEPRKDY